jgi:hypothetical protein
LLSILSAPNFFILPLQVPYGCCVLCLMRWHL